MPSLLAPLLVSLVCTAAPDGGVLPVKRSHQVKWLPDTPGQAFRARVDVETFAVPEQQDHAVESLALTLPDGGTTPALERINDALYQPLHVDRGDARPSLAALAQGQAPLYADLESRLARQEFGGTQNVTVTLPFARGPFLLATVCVDFVGAYPSVNCDEFRWRVDTGATWSWEDAIARPKHAALQKLCRERLAAEAKAERARLQKEHREPWDAALEIRCEPADLRDMTPRSDGSLYFTVFRGPHASGNYQFGFQLTAKELKALADPQGPFGPAGRAR